MGPAIWLALARDELRAAELLAEHGIAPLSCLHADQAIEKALRALQVHREGRGDGAGTREAGGRQGDGEPRRPNSPRLPPAARVPAPSPPLGARRRGIAAALASLSLQSTHRQPASGDPEADLAREAVQVAQQLIERITERVYGGVGR